MFTSLACLDNIVFDFATLGCLDHMVIKLVLSSTIVAMVFQALSLKNNKKYDYPTPLSPYGGRYIIEVRDSFPCGDMYVSPRVRGRCGVGQRREFFRCRTI